MNDIDIDRIKAEIPIANLIGNSFTLRRDGANRLTTEEHDSLKIFTNNNSWTWYSQAGRDGKALGGSVIDWYQFIHRCDTSTAIRELWSLLNGGTLPPAPPLPAMPKRESASWREDGWQRKAIAAVEEGIDRLFNLPAGGQGRAYLTERGISLDMALAYDLGFAMVWNSKAKREMPAILLPWQNQQITAVQYRFIGVTKDDEAARFAQVAGGVRYLFGLQRCPKASDGELGTLILVEGELNAVAIQHILYGQTYHGVVSYGPKSNLGEHNAKTIQALARRYQHVIVWADDTIDSENASGILGRRVTPIHSPRGHDANDLLREGQLGDFLSGLMDGVRKLDY